MPIQVSHERIQQAVDRLLALVPEYKVPVPVEMIAQLRGVRLRFVAHNDNLLGLLLWEDGRPVIGVNTQHDRIWQRFIIAHELAHIELRHYNSIHIDRRFPAFLKAEWQPSAIEFPEIEASVAAACLLIPEASLAADLKGRHIDYLDDTLLRSLAERYQSSVQTMLLRLAM
jgi:Zn-dependent peptidase ImmA (M78 family)